MRSEPVNAQRPERVPRDPMGAIPCIARLVALDGSSWWVPAIANRWTDTHVMVQWRPDPRDPRRERTVWLCTSDVRPWVHVRSDS